MSPSAIQKLLLSSLHLPVDEQLAGALSRYLDLLTRWNARTNLTAIREPRQIVLRHFGESLQCARALPPGIRSLLDYGSGAGFPGAICALAHPNLAVILAESQGKKAAFLQELCRSIPLSAVVHAARVETLPSGRRFDAVTLRAVDRMEEACESARRRVALGGWLVLMTTRHDLQALAPKLSDIAWRPAVPIAGSEHGVIALGRVLKH